MCSIPILCLRSCAIKVEARNLFHYNIGKAAGHNDTQSSVSDVYITSITARWKSSSAAPKTTCLKRECSKPNVPWETVQNLNPRNPGLRNLQTQGYEIRVRSVVPVPADIPPARRPGRRCTIVHPARVQARLQNSRSLVMRRDLVLRGILPPLMARVVALSSA